MNRYLLTILVAGALAFATGCKCHKKDDPAPVSESRVATVQYRLEEMQDEEFDYDDWLIETEEVTEGGATWILLKYHPVYWKSVDYYPHHTVTPQLGYGTFPQQIITKLESRGYKRKEINELLVFGHKIKASAGNRQALCKAIEDLQAAGIKNQEGLFAGLDKLSCN